MPRRHSGSSRARGRRRSDSDFIYPYNEALKLVEGEGTQAE